MQDFLGAHDHPEAPASPSGGYRCTCDDCAARAKKRELNQLKAAIAASGLSNSAFARQVLVRDPRQLRRWLAGTSDIPLQVVEWLAHEKGHNETVTP